MNRSILPCRAPDLTKKRGARLSDQGIAWELRKRVGVQRIVVAPKGVSELLLTNALLK
jgi:hypothetical protein